MNNARSAEPRLVDLAWAARHPPGDVLAALGSTPAGLASASAAENLAHYGPNVLDTSKVTTLDILVRQLRNPLLILLLSAAGVSAATGDVTDGIIVATIVMLGIGLGLVNEYRSEVAVAALHDNIDRDALVWRDGTQRRVDVRDLVPGNVIDVRVGDVIPADVRRLFAEGARVVAVATCASPASSPSSTGAKADAGASITKLNQLGIAVEIITGDNGTVAAKVCRDIGLTVEQVLTAPRNIAEDAVVTRASISSLRRTRRIRRNAARSISLSAAKITTPPSTAGEPGQHHATDGGTRSPRPLGSSVWLRRESYVANGRRRGPDPARARPRDRVRGGLADHGAGGFCLPDRCRRRH